MNVELFLVNVNAVLFWPGDQGPWTVISPSECVGAFVGFHLLIARNPCYGDV